MPTTNDQIDELLEQQVIQNDKLDNRDGFFMKLVTGTRDDPDSFDEDGLPSTDPDHGDLGFYPVFAADGTTVYRPCLDRIRATAEETGGSMAMSIFGDDAVAYTTLSMVDIGRYMGRLAGDTGSYVLVPIQTGGETLRLEQSAGVIMPFTGAGRARLFSSLENDGVRVTLGASNAPLPQPPGPQEPLDLGSGGLVYGEFGVVTPLGIQLPLTTPTDATFNLTIPPGLDLVTITPYRTWTPTTFGFDFSDPSTPSDPTAGPWLIDGPGLVTPVYINKFDTESHISWDEDNHPTLAIGAGFTSPGLGINLLVNDDPLLTQTPHRFEIEVVAKIPMVATILAQVGEYATGYILFASEWNGFVVTVGNSVTSHSYYQHTDRDYAGVHTYKMVWLDEADGPGGTFELFQDGVSLAEPYYLSSKPRISTGAQLFINSNLGNGGPSTAGVQLHSYQFGYDVAGIDYDYANYSATTISAANIVKLGVDARSISTQQPQRNITYSQVTGVGTHGPESTLGVIVGEVILPATRAYKAVLITYDDEGAEVAHPNELVMTKFTAQNCCFEDVWLFASTPRWSECVPQGPAPVIDGIVYTCNAIRMGTYTQFQFGYHLSADTNPTEPFGELHTIPGLVTFMRPHKWYIYDSEDTLLARIEQPNGDPLNKNWEKPAFQGPWTSILSGRPGPHTTSAEPYYLSGTIGSGVAWDSHDLVDHDRDTIEQQMMIPDRIVPWGSHIDSSTNGFDFRYAFGGANSSGQFNGWSNHRIMSYEPTNYDEYVAAVGTTLDPCSNLDTTVNRSYHGCLWLKYTPFNQHGRSVITGPGGVRDDRQALPEPVAVYVSAPDSLHPHNGVEMRTIAIDYLRAYVSDPWHIFEGGKIDPIYKADQRRAVTMNGHYYGSGDLGTPVGQRFYMYIGRVGDWVAEGNPLRVNEINGSDPDRPWRGGQGIDLPHAHQYPGWGSILWRTPEFAFYQAKHYDQCKLYQNQGGVILGQNLRAWAIRDCAWMFLHTALVWKLSSKNSPRLYPREDIIKWACRSFDDFYDYCYASTPGYLNPPVEGATSNHFTPTDLMTMAMTARFGLCEAYNPGDAEGVTVQTFMRGYWVTALGHGEKLGFNQAVRDYSDKAGAVLDWIIAQHRRHICGHYSLPSMLKQRNGYNDVLIPGSALTGMYPEGNDWLDPLGPIQDLPFTWEELAETYGLRPSWDLNPSDDPDGQNVDGQGLDATLAIPSILKYALGCEGEDIDHAVEVAAARFQQKWDEESAKPGWQRGQAWHKFNQSSHVPIRPPS